MRLFIINDRVAGYIDYSSQYFSLKKFPVFHKYERKIESLESELKSVRKNFFGEKEKAFSYRKSLDEREESIVKLRKKIEDMEYDTGLKEKSANQYKQLLEQERQRIVDLEMHVEALTEDIQGIRDEMSGRNCH